MSPPPSFALSSERPSVAPGRAPSAGARRPGPSAGRPRSSGVDGAPPAGTGLALAPGMKKPWKKGWRFRINMTYWEKKSSKPPIQIWHNGISGYLDFWVWVLATMWPLGREINKKYPAANGIIGFSGKRPLQKNCSPIENEKLSKSVPFLFQSTYPFFESCNRPRAPFRLAV